MSNDPQTSPTVPRFDMPLCAQDIMPRRFKNYILSDRELSTIGFINAFGALCLTFFGIAVGAWFTFYSTLRANAVADPSTRGYFEALLTTSKFASIFLGVAALICLIWAVLDVYRIKRDSLQEQRRRDLLENATKE